jgi:hypothetical protein
MHEGIQIAELTLAVDPDDRPWEWESHYEGFQVESSGQARQSCFQGILVQVHWQGSDGQELGEELASIAKPVPESGVSCRLYRHARGSWVLETDGLQHEAFVRRVAVVSEDWSSANLFVDVRTPELPVYSNPLCPPLDRLLFANLLARRSGMLLHACGVVHQGHGYLFTGPSGAGKTTLARLWSQWDDATVLGEECLAVRSRGSELWLYGTPWIGETRSCSAQGAPLAGIYFLHHARENRTSPRPVTEAVQGLLSRSFVPTFDPLATHQLLDFCLRLSQSVPAYDFGFRPDASAVEFIRRVGPGE